MPLGLNKVLVSCHGGFAVFLFKGYVKLFFITCKQQISLRKDELLVIILLRVLIVFFVKGIKLADILSSKAFCGKGV